MNTLEKLRLAHQQRCQTVDVGGVPVVLAPMNALDGIEIQRHFAAVDGFQGNDPALLNFYVELVARSAVEPDTHAKALDSDEGRALVRSLPMLEQIELGAAAAKVNGFLKPADENDAKKTLGRGSLSLSPVPAVGAALARTVVGDD